MGSKVSSSSSPEPPPPPPPQEFNNPSSRQQPSPLEEIKPPLQKHNASSSSTNDQEEILGGELGTNDQSLTRQESNTSPTDDHMIEQQPPPPEEFKPPLQKHNPNASSSSTNDQEENRGGELGTNDQPLPRQESNTSPTKDHMIDMPGLGMGTTGAGVSMDTADGAGAMTSSLREPPPPLGEFKPPLQKHNPNALSSTNDREENLGGELRINDLPLIRPESNTSPTGDHVIELGIDTAGAGVNIDTTGGAGAMSSSLSPRSLCIRILRVEERLPKVEDDLRKKLLEKDEDSVDNKNVNVFSTLLFAISVFVGLFLTLFLATNYTLPKNNYTSIMILSIAAIVSFGIVVLIVLCRQAECSCTRRCCRLHCLLPIPTVVAVSCACAFIYFLYSAYRDTNH